MRNVGRGNYGEGAKCKVGSIVCLKFSLQPPTHLYSYCLRVQRLFFFSLNLIIIVGSQTIILTIVQKGVNTVKQKKKITSSPRSSSLSCHPQESPAGPEAVPVAELAVGAIADELAGVVDQESGRSRTTSTCQAASMSILKS